jgi:hypothetical protein
MEREVMKKSKQNFILICMYKKIYEPFFKTKKLMYKIDEPFVKTNKIKIYQRPLCQVESFFL